MLGVVRQWQACLNKRVWKLLDGIRLHLPQRVWLDAVKFVCANNLFKYAVVVQLLDCHSAGNTRARVRASL